MKKNNQISIIDKFNKALEKEHPDIATMKKNGNAHKQEIAGYDFELSPTKNMHFSVLHRKDGTVIIQSYDKNHKVEQVTHTVIKNEI